MEKIYENDKIIYRKNTRSVEEWFKYNDKDVLIKYENSNGVLKEYNDDGHRTHFKSPDKELFWEYDNGKYVRYIETGVLEVLYEYNTDGVEIKTVLQPNGEKTVYKSNKITYHMTSDGIEEWYETIRDGGLGAPYTKHYKNSRGFEQWIKYICTDRGVQITEYRDNTGVKLYYEYNDGILMCARTKKSEVKKYTNKFLGRFIVKPM